MSEKKFEENDLPKILLALQKARDAKSPSKVTVDFSADGGVIGILFEPKIKIK